MLQQLTTENPEALWCIGFYKTFILKFKEKSISILLFIGWGESVSSVGIVLVFSTFFLRFFCVFSAFFLRRTAMRMMHRRPPPPTKSERSVCCLSVGTGLEVFPKPTNLWNTKISSHR